MATVAEAFVTLRPDLKDFEKETKSGLSGLGGLAKTAALGIAAAGAALLGVAAIGVKAAMDEQVGIERLAQAVNANGGDWAVMGGAIEGTIAKMERLTAFSDGEMRDALSLLVAQTGDVTEATARLPVAMDFARGAGIDLATASKLLGKVTDETTSVLGRYGIRVEKGADATDVLRLVQQKFAGQAETFAKTAAGSWAIFGNQMDNLKEDFGTLLLPALQTFASAATGAIDGIRAVLADPAVQGAILGIVGALGTIKDIALELFGVLTGMAPDAGAKLTEAIGPEAASFIMGGLAMLRDTAKTVFELMGKGITFLSENWDAASFAIKAMVAFVIVPAFVSWAASAVAAAAATIVALAPVLVPIAAIGAAAFLLYKVWTENLGGVRTATEGIVAFLSGAFQTIVGAVESLWQSAQAIWVQFTENPPRMIGLMIGSVIGFFLTLPTRIATTLGDALGAVGRFKDDAVIAFQTFVKENGTAIGDFLTGLPGKFWDGAVAAVKGLIGGLGSMAGAALKAVADLFGGIVSGVKSSLGIKSPSKVFEQIGANMLRGLEVGLKAPVAMGGLAGLNAIAGASGFGGAAAQRPIILQLDGRVLAEVVGERTQQRSFLTGGALG